ncbi:MAG: lytic murein transglycosylase [Syntrophaceae bacterium]|nr:lytic murein transglycosylase [Syntrophaceae bacterium]
MKFKYSLITFLIVFIFLGCAPEMIKVKKIPDSVINVRMKELKQRLASNGVPDKWFDDQINDFSFRLHFNIGQYFQKSAEKQTDLDKKHNLAWYFALVGVDAKIKKGKAFVEDYTDVLKRAEAKHGIHKELIAAIIGIETNYADRRYRGKFYVFNSLVSQFIFTNRKSFSVRELTSLYKFSRKTDQSPWLKGSYAGAIGWGQFIPSSLLSFFVDENGINDDIDPFSIEDTIFSIENYLHKNGLSKSNIGNQGARYSAVYAYNHSDAYVKAVLYIYKGLRN